MSELSDYKRLVVEPDERAMRAKLAGLRGRVEAAEFSLALLLAARAEGPAPVSAPLDREGVARIIDPDGFARREQHLRVSAEWHEKAEKFAATENPAPYPDGRFAVERIVEAWRGVAEKHATYAETDVRHAYAKADAILALSQQVGLTTPAASTDGAR